ncbi:signal recognition particle-docking protein FtsY [Natranaeroarchaeum aerophilus]|uniref:Signal recognition particle receptor FtsY n=1 Tax=Natranaeroarchaeum aerophilus TaxID=2917711 RepID=A0AAE3FSE8_9EURY|nr:signal recognition particle-docking protein FtsY [Natranaeroarchaeum aerophilus]MCL9813679.1 signal recognition particle-docking protein FtsY [Natranaeroarchaeum aerophilus]
MFDSLKEKLGSFREDVEESAEEKAEAEADAADEDAADVEATADAADAEAEPADADASVAAQDAEAATAATDADGTATAPDAAESTTPEPAGTDADSADESDGPGFAKRAKSVATGQTIIEEEDVEAPLDELEMALLQSDVELTVVDEILATIREETIGETHRFTKSTTGVVQRALRKALVDVISVGQFDFDERVATADKPLVIIFTGVNGVGKTTSIAKMAKYLEERGHSSVLANGDTYRAGANEQIEEHADALGKKLITHQQGGDPAAVIYDGVEYAEANDVDVVLGDTAGRLHTSNDLMEQLEKIDRVVDPDMTLFVDEAVAGQDAVQRSRQFNDAAEIDGTILTKADADSQGGAAISIAHVTGKPILFLGVGQGYDDLEKFEPERLVDRLLGLDG